MYLRERARARLAGLADEPPAFAIAPSAVRPALRDRGLRRRRDALHTRGANLQLPPS